jgi:hypothetical protein
MFISLSLSFLNSFQDMKAHGSLAPAKETSAVFCQGYPRALDLPGAGFTTEVRCQLEDLRKS